MIRIHFFFGIAFIVHKKNQNWTVSNKISFKYEQTKIGFYFHSMEFWNRLEKSKVFYLIQLVCDFNMNFNLNMTSCLQLCPFGEFNHIGKYNNSKWRLDVPMWLDYVCVCICVEQSILQVADKAFCIEYNAIQYIQWYAIDFTAINVWNRIYCSKWK